MAVKHFEKSREWVKDLGVRFSGDTRLEGVGGYVYAFDGGEAWIAATGDGWMFWTDLAGDVVFDYLANVEEKLNDFLVESGCL